MNVRIDGRRVAWQRIGDEVLLVDPANGRVAGLNPVASFVWPQLESTDLEILAHRVSVEFDVSPSQAAEDIARFVARMRARGFLKVGDDGL